MDRKERVEEELKNYGIERFYDDILDVPQDAETTDEGKFYLCYSGEHDNNSDSRPNLHVNLDDGVYDCKACAITGNVWTLIEDHPKINRGKGEKLNWMEDFLDLTHPKQQRSGAPTVPYTLDILYDELKDAGEVLANKLSISESIIKTFEIKKITDPDGQLYYFFPNIHPGKRVLYYKIMTDDLRNKFFANDPDDMEKNLDLPYPYHLYHDGDAHVQQLWVVEGEKDVLTLADRGHHALTGPSGVNTSASENMVEMVKEIDPDEVIIAFDQAKGNDQIEKQELKLREELINYNVSRIKWPDIREDGWDVRDEIMQYGEDSLLDFKRPFPIDDGDAYPSLPDWKEIDGNRLYEHNGEIWQSNQGKPDKRVASFTIRAKEIIEQTDEDQPDVYRTVMKSPSGTTIEKDISTEEFKSVSDFRGKHKEHWARWHGGMNNLLELQEQLSSHARNKKIGVNKYGYWKDFNIFVFGDRIIDKDGVNESSKYTLSMPQPSSWEQAFIEEDQLAGEEEKEFVGNNLYHAHTRKFVTTAVSYWAISWLRTWFIEKRAGFPTYNVHGESGCGKTEFIAHVICPLHSIDMYRLPTAESTKFGMISTFSSSYGSVFPVDEIKSDLKSKKIEWLQHVIREAYDGKLETKGAVRGNELTIDTYEYHSSMAVIGEMSLLTDKSMFDRSIPVTLSRSFLRSEKGDRATECFNNFTEKPKQFMARICNSYLTFLCRQKNQGSLDKIWAKTDDMVDDMLSNRKYRNLRILAMGGILWERFCDQIDMRCISNIGQEAVNHVKHEYNKNHSDVLGRQLNELDFFFSDLATMAMQEEIIPTKHYKIKNGEVQIHVKSCYQEWKDWTKQMSGETASIDYNSLRGLIRNESDKNKTYIKEKQKVCNWGSSIRCTVLDEEFLRKHEDLEMMGFFVDEVSPDSGDFNKF